MKLIFSIHSLMATIFFANGMSALSDTEIWHILERTRPGYENWLKSIDAKPIIDNEQLIFWASECKDPFASIVTKSVFENAHDLESAVKDIVNKARMLKTPVGWMVGPHARPTNTAALLKEHGFSLVVTYGMVELDVQDAQMQEITNPDIEIKKLDSDNIDAWLAIVAPAFEYNAALTRACLKYLKEDVVQDSHMQEHYAGYYKGKLVTTGTLLIEYYGGGHIYDIATLPEAQHNGMATAMMQFIVQRARELKIKTLNLLATDAGKSIYDKLGFKKLFDIDMYVLNSF